VNIIMVYKKMSLELPGRFKVNQPGLKHGQQGWAKVQGRAERVLVFYNRYLPDETSWFDRWMTLEDLRKTPKPESACYPEEKFPLSSVRHGFVKTPGASSAEINDAPEGLQKILDSVSNVRMPTLP
jgi:hypothetical protein